MLNNDYNWLLFSMAYLIFKLQQLKEEAFYI